MVKVIKTKKKESLNLRSKSNNSSLGKSIMDNHNEGQRMDFGTVETLPKAFRVGPLFPRKATAAAKKSRIQMEKDRQAKIEERTKRLRNKK